MSHTGITAGSEADNLQSVDPILSEEEELSHVGGLSDRDMAMATEAIRIASTSDGNLLECRKQLIVKHMHPIEVRSPQPQDSAPVAEFIEEEEAHQADAKEEFDLIIDPAFDDNVNWEIPDPKEELSTIQESVAEQPRDESEINSGWPSVQPHSIQPGLEQFLLKNFSTLYTSLKAGIDATLASNLEIKVLVQNLTAEVRTVKDEQHKIGAQLLEVKSQLSGLQRSTTTGQCNLQEIREEISICTAGFSKINSALLQMNAANIPQGALPNLSSYKFEPNPTVMSVKEGIKTTPIAYPRERLTQLLRQVHMPEDKIPISVAMLENRTPRSFSMLISKLNPAAGVSDEAAQALINMPDIKTPEELKLAFLHLRVLCNRQSSTPDNDANPPLVTPDTLTQARPLVAPQPAVASTKVKRCANPFAQSKH